LGGGAKSVATHLSTGYTFNGPAQNYHQLRWNLFRGGWPLMLH
jgi:hypothetical protein